MTKHENTGHDNKILNMMRLHDLCTIDTYVGYMLNQRGKWSIRYRHCNTIYIPKDSKDRPTKLDYRLPLFFKPLEIHGNKHECETGTFDPSLRPSARSWVRDHHMTMTNENTRNKRSDFSSMNDQSWVEFDFRL